MTSVMAARPAVQLLEDEGEAAACERSFFRGRAHLRAEGVSHTLVVSTAHSWCAVPLVVRPIPGTDRHDAVSPYGYPGGSLTGSPPDISGNDLSSTGLVTVFVRDRIGRPSFSGGTRRSRVFVHEPDRPRRTGRSFRRSLRACTAAGYTAEVLPGPDVDDDTLAGFTRAYALTMQHVGAADRYLFDTGYLIDCLRYRGSWLAVTRSSAGDVAAAELVVASDGLLHSYLAATCSEHRAASPGKLATAALLDLADRLGLTLNHGGGVRPGDGLEVSKRSYCNADLPFVTHELVADEDAYRAMSRHAAAAPDDFFPGYRRPPLASAAGTTPNPEETG